MAHVAIERESAILVEFEKSVMKYREIPGKEKINILVPHIVGALLRRIHFWAVHAAIEQSLCVCRIRDLHGAHEEAVIDKPYNPPGSSLFRRYSATKHVFSSLRTR